MEAARKICEDIYEARGGTKKGILATFPGVHDAMPFSDDEDTGLCIVIAKDRAFVWPKSKPELGWQTKFSPKEPFGGTELAQTSIKVSPDAFRYSVLDQDGNVVLEDVEMYESTHHRQRTKPGAMHEREGVYDVDELPKMEDKQALEKARDVHEWFSSSRQAKVAGMLSRLEATRAVSDDIKTVCCIGDYVCVKAHSNHHVVPQCLPRAFLGCEGEVKLWNGPGYTFLLQCGERVCLYELVVINVGTPSLAAPSYEYLPTRHWVFDGIRGCTADIMHNLVSVFTEQDDQKQRRDIFCKSESGANHRHHVSERVSTRGE